LLYLAMTAQALWQLTHRSNLLSLVSALLELLAAPPLVYLLWFRRSIREHG
jgi:hypothetical protein